MFRLAGIVVAMLGVAAAAQAVEPRDTEMTRVIQHNTISAPELGVAGLFGAASLLAGGIAVIRGRRKK
ncbi:MAG TPA: hypothetical protein VME21_13840 [Steroidobacteraceae bacterium]|nr:hypothetical protein [Steroidobacteraceae bacterium]